MAAPSLTDSIIGTLAQPARKVSLSIAVAGNDWTALVTNHLLNLCYKESFSDDTHAYTLELSLADPEGLFRRTFPVKAGMTVQASFVMQGWAGPGTGTSTKVLSPMWVHSCSDKFTDKLKPVTDHCHATNGVRSLLCHPCNMALGLMRDSPKRCFKLYNYALSFELLSRG